MTLKNDKRNMLIMLLIAVIAGCGMLIWGQYNTALQVYDISFNRYMITKQLLTDETWVKLPEEQALYEKVLTAGKEWRESTAKRQGVYTAITASEVFGKVPPQELSYEYYDNGSKKTVVILHGYNETADDAAVFAPIWWEKGFNILLPEMRGHSESSVTTTFGFYEQYDLMDLIMCEKLTGEGRKLVIHGKGTGAAAALLMAGNSHIPNEAYPDLIVSDSVYSNLKELELKQLKQQFSLGNFMVGIMLDAVVNSKLGFSVKDVDISKAAAQTDTPIIFIACEKDGFVGSEQSEAVFQAAGTDKEMLLVEDAKYGMSYAVSRHSGNMYESLINKWIEKLSF